MLKHTLQFQHTLKSSHTPPIGQRPWAEMSQDSFFSAVSQYKFEDSVHSPWGQIFYAAIFRLSFAFSSLPPVPQTPGYLSIEVVFSVFILNCPLFLWLIKQSILLINPLLYCILFCACTYEFTIPLDWWDYIQHWSHKIFCSVQFCE